MGFLNHQQYLSIFPEVKSIIKLLTFVYFQLNLFGVSNGKKATHGPYLVYVWIQYVFELL